MWARKQIRTHPISATQCNFSFTQNEKLKLRNLSIDRNLILFRRIYLFNVDNFYVLFFGKYDYSLLFRLFIVTGLAINGVRVHRARAATAGRFVH